MHPSKTDKISQILKIISKFFVTLKVGHPDININLFNINKVLIIRLDEIGDVVLAVPFLRELRRNLPNAWISLVVNHNTFNMVELCPYVNEILIYNWIAHGVCLRLKRHWKTIKFCRKFLWRHRFDLGIIPRWDVDLYNASYLLYFSLTRNRVAYSEKVTPEKASFNHGIDFLFTKTIQSDDQTHEVNRNLLLLKDLGGKIIETKLELWTDNVDQFFAQTIIDEFTSDGANSFFAIGAGSKSPNRMWPIAHFIEIAAWLIEEFHAKIILLGGKEDGYLSKIFNDNLLENTLNLIGKTTLRQTAAVLKHCHLYIGNDSGPMHIAAAMGVPVVGISCHPRQGDVNHHNSPSRFAPWETSHIMLQPEAKPPCIKSCLSPTAHCIKGITVEQVKEAVIKQVNILK